MGANPALQQARHFTFLLALPNGYCCSLRWVLGPARGSGPRWLGRWRPSTSSSGAAQRVGFAYQVLTRDPDGRMQL